MTVYIHLSLLLKRSVQKVQGMYRDDVFIREKRLRMEIAVTRSRRYFLSHGNSRDNPDIEINNNVHHAKRHNTETVSNRVPFP